MWKMVRNWWRRRTSDACVLNLYIETGTTFGDAVSMIYMGECVGFASLLDEWQDAEEEILFRGYRSLCLDEFVEAGGWGRPLPPIMRRTPQELPVSHAEFYRRNFLGKIAMNDGVRKALEGQPSVGHYVMPSTRHLQ